MSAASSSSATRIRLISLAIFLVGAVLIYRLFFLQIVRGDHYTGLANRQYQVAESNAFDRGSIFFQEKSGRLVSAAAVAEGFRLTIDPGKILDPLGTYQALAPIVPVEQSIFLTQAAKEGDSYEEVWPQLAEEPAQRVAALNLPGVFLQKDRWRTYPAERLAAHVIGFLGYDESNERAGRYGLEREYNATLEREASQSFAGFIQTTLNELGRSVLGKEPAPTAAADLVLTIEPSVQSTLETELAQAVSHWQADAAGGVVLDPQTGEVRALAAWPNFHPGESQANLVFLANPVVESVFELGSIFKPLTMAAALDAGALTPTTTYYDSGFLVIGDKQIANYDGRGRGLVNMQEVLNQSLNTGAVFAMRALGGEKFKDYLQAYALAEPTGIDLPNEASGLLRNLESGREIEYATASFGQGIAVTPLAMARSLSALANGGRLVTPHVVDKLVYSDSREVEDLVPAPGQQIIKPETSRTITQMLVRVTDEALAGGTLKLANYQVAAKTGTAQIVNPAGGYYTDRYLHSFFGYFPASQPRFLVLLYLVNPKNVRYSSETLSQPFMTLAKFLLNYYGVPPDRNLNV